MTEIDDKVFAYSKSKLFPWNFLIEAVDDEAIEHFMSYVPKKSWKIKSPDELREVIAKEIKNVVDDYLFDPKDPNARSIHGKFARVFPFAYSQCLAHVLVYGSPFESLDEVVDLDAVAKLLGTDITHFKKQEASI
ncbi:MAG: hypothetical protein ACXQT5_04415, partial [Candidatus Syntropharchaeia archaeon]